MADTTLTFTSWASQAPVEIVDDPSMPGWPEDFGERSRQELLSDSIVVMEDETDHLLRSKANAAHLRRSIEQHRKGEVFPDPVTRE